MKKRLTATLAVFSLCSLGGAGLADTTKGEKIDGKAEFEKHCAACHPNGGNIINQAKGIGKKQLEANNVKGAKGIVGKMRKPGPGMTQFDKKAISDKEAKAIADYILKTFK
jgi:cytochrome c6